MHVNRLVIGEFLPKKLGFKKNVLNAPKFNVIRNAMLSKTKTPALQLEISEQFKDIITISKNFAPNKLYI